MSSAICANAEHPELDALELEEDAEGASYLADINKVPDYLDEAPLEENEVSRSQKLY